MSFFPSCLSLLARLRETVDLAENSTEHAMTATPPSRIAIPPRPNGADVFGTGNGNASSSPVDPATGYPNRRIPSRSVRQSFSTVGGGRRRVSRAPLGGLEDLDPDEANAKLPTLVPGIRQAYSTPLPVLPMIVLCIVRCSYLKRLDKHATLRSYRLCCPSYCRRICALHFCFPWSRVSHAGHLADRVHR